MPGIDFSRQAERTLRKLPAKHAKQIVRRIQALASHQTSVETAELRGHEPLRRMKSGEYRVIFLVEEDTLKILLIDKRNDDEIYRLVERFMR